MIAAGFNHLKACRHGYMLYNHNDVYVGRSLDLYGEMSEGEVEMFHRVLRPGHIVVEVGANMGAHTLPLAKRVGSAGAVLAFEPQRLLFQTLCANMALNSIAHAHCWKAAVGERPAKMLAPTLDPDLENNFGGLRLGDHTEGDVVDVIRLDDVPLPHCRLIKVDVEGMELHVLRGAEQTLRTHRPILYVENNEGERAVELIDFLETLGYLLYAHQPPLYRTDNFFNNPINVFGDIVSFNMLCLLPEHDVDATDLELV